MEVATDFVLPRAPFAAAWVHTTSRAIDDDVGGAHAAAIRRLVKTQPALLRWVNRAVRARDVDDRTPAAARYQLGALLRMFELADGSVPRVDAGVLARAEEHVAVRLRAEVDGRRLFPFDEGFVARARRFRRCQATVLDAFLAVCFEVPGQSLLADDRKAELYVLSWVLVTALDHAWAPVVSSASPDRRHP